MPDSMPATEIQTTATAETEAPADVRSAAPGQGTGHPRRAPLRGGPELGMDVVELALIRQIIIGTDASEIKMVLTTPFCPYAGSMVQQIQDAAEEVLEHPVKVTLLAERWDPREAGLTW